MPGVDHVAALARADVVAVRALATLDLVQHHGRVFASMRVCWALTDFVNAMSLGY
jgi:hypothetical protein